MRNNIYEIEAAREAIKNRQYGLADRYLQNALEAVWCMYCHRPLHQEAKPYKMHYKGFVHDECKEKYNGRIDYENQHSEPIIEVRRSKKGSKSKN